MLRKKAPMDLLHGPLAGQLLRFTIPIALSSIVQQLFNAADTAVAGRFGSENALAAVGTNTETVALIVALIVALSAGLSVGVNVHVAALIGKGRKSGIPSAIRTAVCLAVLIGLFGLIAGQGAAAPLLRLLRTPDSIFRPAEQYLRIYLLGYPFLLLYDFGAAVLRARGDSRYPFFALMLSGVINVGLNVFFVVVLRTDVAGVAAATGISALFSAVLVLFRLAKDEPRCLSFGGLRGMVSSAAAMLKTGVPSAVQGAVFCFANMFVQASVNRFGETAIAGSTIAMSFEYFTYHLLYHYRLRADGDHLYRAERRCRTDGALQNHIPVLSRSVNGLQRGPDLYDRAVPQRLLRSVYPRSGDHRQRRRPHPVYPAV